MIKTLLAVMCVLGLLVGPAAADDVTGSETQEATLDCIPEGDPVPETQEAPEYTVGECTDDPGTADDESRPPYTYEGLVWTNEVTCDADNQGVAGVLTGDATQEGTGGEMGLCTDGALPIHGRLVMGGSTDSGMYVYIDGDSSNEGPLSGWARADAGPGGATVRCGDDAGRLDASDPTGADGQEDCG